MYIVFRDESFASARARMQLKLSIFQKQLVWHFICYLPACELRKTKQQDNTNR
jgi:hypothetical protein